MRRFVLSIDPGTTKSGVCLVRTDDMRPVWCAKLENASVRGAVVREMAAKGWSCNDLECVIERMYNPYSADSNVFLTCEWIGRFDVYMREITGAVTKYVYRYEEYKDLCANMYPRNDKGVRAALVDRFAYGQPNFGKGNSTNRGWFYGFNADVWSAYAIAVTHIDMEALREDSQGC